MAHQAKLGENGLIDKQKLYGAPAAPKGRRVFPARQGRWVVQVPNDEMEELALNIHEVAARFGGIMLLNYFKGTQHSRSGRQIRT